MKTKISGITAHFTVQYTDTGKRVIFKVLDGIGIADSLSGAIATVREWINEHFVRNCVSDAEYNRRALEYARSLGLQVKLEGFRWFILTRDGKQIAIYQASTFKTEDEALTEWAAPRLPTESLATSH